MPSTSHGARRRARYPRRHSDTEDPDTMPSQDDYDWEREETRLLPAPLHLHSRTSTYARTLSPDTDSDTDLYDATPPHAKENPFLDLELLNCTPQPPAMLVQLQKIVEELKADPIEPTLDELRRNMETSKMIAILLDAEAALLRGDTDTAEEKANSARFIAISLEDAEYRVRCDVLQGFVAKLRALQERRNIVDEYEDEDEEGKGKEVVRVAEQGPGRGQRRFSGSDAGLGEVVGNLKGESMFEREELEDEDEEGDGDGDGDGDYVKVKVRGQHAEQSNSVDFNPRQLQSPVPPEEENEGGEMALQRYDPRSASANSQGFSSSSSSSYCPEDSLEDDLSSDETTVLRTLTRKRKSTLIAPSTILAYTHIHQTKRKPYTLTQRSTLGPSRPKPWTPIDANAAADEDFHRVFWNAHSKTLLLQQPILGWDMAWLSRCEFYPFTPPKAHFTFRFSLPMKCMAGRVRKTVIFPRQEWEFIPSPVEWRRFCEGMENGERVTMSFLGWELERIAVLMQEEKGGEVATLRDVQREGEVGTAGDGHADTSHGMISRGDPFAKMSDARLKKAVMRRARASLEEGDWKPPEGQMNSLPGMSNEELLKEMLGTRVAEPLDGDDKDEDEDEYSEISRDSAWDEDSDEEDRDWKWDFCWPSLEQLALFVFVCICLRILYAAGLRALYAASVRLWAP